jgi:hypothetical protein
MHCLSSIYFVSQPVHVSGIFVAHHQEVYCIYTTIGRCYAFQLTVTCHTTRWAYFFAQLIFDSHASEIDIIFFP